MIDNYEAAELLEVARAQDVILGTKDIDFPDNTSEPPPELQPYALAMFDE